MEMRNRPGYTYLILLSFFLVTPFGACKEHPSTSEVDGYYHEGQLYAYGSIIVGQLDEIGELSLSQQTGVNNLDAEQGGIFDIVDAEQRSVLLVDYHKTKRIPVIYSHKVITKESTRRSSGRDVWMELKVVAPSYQDQNTRYVYIGYTESNADKAPIVLYSQLSVSRIAYGDKQGDTVLHFAADSIRSKPYSQHYCRVMLNLPEHLSWQVPSSFDPGYCSSVTPQEDICSSTPSRKDCLPDFPEKLLAMDEGGLSINGEKMLKISENRFRLVGNEQVGVIFVENLDSSSKLSSEHLAFHIRTSENRQHDHCQVRHNSVRSDELDSLVFEVIFDGAKTYEDKVCNLVVEDTKSGATDYIQIIKR